MAYGDLRFRGTGFSVPDVGNNYLKYYFESND